MSLVTFSIIQNGHSGAFWINKTISENSGMKYLQKKDDTLERFNRQKVYCIPCLREILLAVCRRHGRPEISAAQLKNCLNTSTVRNRPVSIE